MRRVTDMSAEGESLTQLIFQKLQFTDIPYITVHASHAGQRYMLLRGYTVKPQFSELV